MAARQPHDHAWIGAERLKSNNRRNLILFVRAKSEKITSSAGRWWEVRDAAGALVCLTVYHRRAREVVRWLSLATALW